MNEIIYASDLCKLYLENCNVMKSIYRNELYNQINFDLFEYENEEYKNEEYSPYLHIIGSYYINHNKLIVINIIGKYKHFVRYVSYLELKSFIKYGDNSYQYYYYPKYGKINVDFYENMMKKIEILDLNNIK